MTEIRDKIRGWRREIRVALREPQEAR